LSISNHPILQGTTKTDDSHISCTWGIMVVGSMKDVLIW
jgi:hypothetical protein